MPSGGIISCLLDMLPSGEGIPRGLLPMATPREYLPRGVALFGPLRPLRSVEWLREMVEVARGCGVVGWSDRLRETPPGRALLGCPTIVDVGAWCGCGEGVWGWGGAATLTSCFCWAI